MIKDLSKYEIKKNLLSMQQYALKKIVIIQIFIIKNKML